MVYETYREHLNDLQTYIEDLKEQIENLKQKQKWILMSEQEPEVGCHYLITARWDDGSPIVASDDYCSYGWDDFGESVIAWMPLPIPYGEGGKR